MQTYTVVGVIRVVLLFCALGVSAFASAQSTIPIGPFTITCVSSGQLCSPAFSVPVTTNGLLQATYTASPGHCSNVGVHFLVDGVERGVTPFLTPGETSALFDLGPVTPGTHTLSLQAEGTISGCNTGALAAWGGSAQITVNGSAVAPTAVPGPGVLATALMFALGVLFFRRRIFRG